MTVHTALQIFRNADDLAVTVRKANGVRGYGGSICFGPGRRYRLLVSTSKVLKTREEAVAVIGSALDSACETGKEFFGRRPLKGELTRTKCRQIIAALRIRSTVETFRR